MTEKSLSMQALHHILPNQRHETQPPEVPGGQRNRQRRRGCDREAAGRQSSTRNSQRSPGFRRCLGTGRRAPRPRPQRPQRPRHHRVPRQHPFTHHCITDTPPAEVQADLHSLEAALDATIPAKQAGQNLLIATWNLRAFASLTRKWTASASDDPKRDLRGLRAIGDIVSRFDVVAIQEVKGDLRALRDLMRYLGDTWAFLMTDVTAGAAGNDERIAFVFDLKRLKPSGLACELVVPPEWLEDIGEDALQRQFARTPYAVSFVAGQTTFILVTAHIDYADKAAKRIPELKAIARWMKEWASRSNRWHHNLLTLGDFNIDRADDPLWKAFTSTGLTVPAQLSRVPRTIFSNPAKPDLDKFYDQIAWFESGNAKLVNMTCRRGGNFDFLPHVYTNIPLSKANISHRISDHYPLWVEFGLT